jgi:hypothetical protein
MGGGLREFVVEKIDEFREQEALFFPVPVAEVGHDLKTGNSEGPREEIAIGAKFAEFSPEHQVALLKDIGGGMPIAEQRVDVPVEAILTFREGADEALGGGWRRHSFLLLPLGRKRLQGSQVTRLFSGLMGGAQESFF